MTKNNLLDQTAQSMSDAPRDGTRILVCNPTQSDGECIGIGSWCEWDDGKPLWCIDGGEGWEDAACTAWWPLPEVITQKDDSNG